MNPWREALSALITVLIIVAGAALAVLAVALVCGCAASASASPDCDAHVDDQAEHAAIFAARSCVPLTDELGIRVACPQSDGTEWSRVDFSQPPELSTGVWFYRYTTVEQHRPVMMLCSVGPDGQAR